MTDHPTDERCSVCFYARERSRIEGGVPTPYLACAKRAPQVVTTDIVPSSNTQWVEVQLDDWCGEFSYPDPLIYGQQSGFDVALWFERSFLTTAAQQVLNYAMIQITVPPGTSLCASAQVTYSDLANQNIGMQTLSVMLGTDPNTFITTAFATGSLTTIGTMSVGTLSIGVEAGSNVVAIFFNSNSGPSVFVSASVLLDWGGTVPPIEGVNIGLRPGGGGLGGAALLGRGGG